MTTTEQKAAVVRQVLGRRLYVYTGWESAPIAPLNCLHTASSVLEGGYANRARQCGYRARVFFGGMGFCWRHAMKVADMTGLTADEDNDENEQEQDHVEQAEGHRSDPISGEPGS